MKTDRTSPSSPETVVILSPELLRKFSFVYAFPLTRIYSGFALDDVNMITYT